MGYNDENAARLIFDLETAPLPEAAEYLEPADAPANYKDPLKIAAYLADKRLEQLERCGLDVDLCRIVALGLQAEHMPDPWIVRVPTERDERIALSTFWSTIGDHHLVGFNCLAFDLPVLFRRSLYLGIETRHIQIDRFKHPRVTDLMEELSYSGKLRLRGLSFYCKRFGIDIPDVLTGADIAAAVTAGEWDAIEAHLRADIQKTAALASRLGYFRVPQAELVL